MKYEKQHRLAAELDARFPRGNLNQNIFRCAYIDHRQNGRSREESEALALALVMKTDPAFIPERKCLSTSTGQ
jgi:hypothetical protein